MGNSIGTATNVTTPAVISAPSTTATNTTTSAANTTTSASSQAASTASPTASPSPAQTAAADASDMRLVIEDDKAAGCFVYKVINRVTGEVVQQTPSEQMVKLRESDGYLAGDVIKAQA